MQKQNKEENVVREADRPVPHVFANDQPHANAAGHETPRFRDADGPPLQIRGKQCKNGSCGERCEFQRAKWLCRRGRTFPRQRRRHGGISAFKFAPRISEPLSKSGTELPVDMVLALH